MGIQMFSPVPAFLDGYVFKSLKGAGTFASVYLATHVSTLQDVAIKIVNRAHLQLVSPESLNNLYREIAIMKMLKHPNIIQLMDVMEDDKNVYLVLEYAEGGDLASYLENHGAMSEDKMLKIVQQTVSALHYCHSHQVVHRDLKPENLLFDKDMNVKIADFGLSTLMRKGEKLSTACGTPSYVAPELFEGKAYTGPEVDAWSLGVVLYKMVTDELPYRGVTVAAISRAVRDCKPPVPVNASRALNEMICGLLVKDPNHRYTIQQVMTSPWTTCNGREQILPYVNLESLQIFPQKSFHQQILKKMRSLGYSAHEVEQSLEQENYDYARATYCLIESQLIQQGVTLTASEGSMVQLQQKRLSCHLQIARQAAAAYKIQEESGSSSEESVLHLLPVEPITKAAARPLRLRRHTVSVSAFQQVVVPVQSLQTPDRRASVSPTAGRFKRLKRFLRRVNSDAIKRQESSERPNTDC